MQPEDSPSRGQQQKQRRPRTAAEVTRNAGLFKDYLAGLDNMRRQVNDCENQLAKAVQEFYKTGDKDEGEFNARCVSINAAFEAANQAIGAAGHTPVIVDGQGQIAALVNLLKSSRSEKSVPIDEILEFWEDFKLVLEQLQVVADDCDRRVVSKLKSSCLMAASAEVDKSQLTEEYLADANKFAKELEQLRSRIRLISHSAGTHVKLELISKSSHADRVLQNCNEDFYPILGVVPDLTVRLEDMARIAYQWLDRDETYLFDVSTALRQKRNETRDMEQELRAERERHRQLLKSVKSAFLMCQNSRRRLRQIEDELQVLQQQIEKSRKDRLARMNEKKQKKEMAEFLEISISQTKMNYTLQLKRQRLMAQIQELEQTLSKTEQQISELKNELSSKSTQQETAKQQQEFQETNFATMKSDLEGFTKKVQEMSTELRSVRHQLDHLESVQNLKTSPEMVDGFYEQQRPVKLAPSLMESINLKRKRVQQGN